MIQATLVSLTEENNLNKNLTHITRYGKLKNKSQTSIQNNLKLVYLKLWSIISIISSTQ